MLLWATWAGKAGDRWVGQHLGWKVLAGWGLGSAARGVAMLRAAQGFWGGCRRPLGKRQGGNGASARPMCEGEGGVGREGQQLGLWRRVVRGCFDGASVCGGSGTWQDGLQGVCSVMTAGGGSL